ncbi:type II secretion system F family protein [Candidatus Peregrinibacteria bacterium]|jgi:type IV pilus assembly protein PilC|nr:type II secretion system F family protein [Candidatus Peregrinibacteria bacterium]MBT7736056.1 type II secretion system F family protein [Candidatus Peregrinibacteria bacterium]
MEFDGLQIGTPKKTVNKEAPEKKEQAADATDYIVDGASGGRDILKKIKRIVISERDDVIYGVYDNRDKPFSVKFNDFLIDRSSVSLKDKSYFFHMLAVMVDAGIPVVQAVKSLAGRSDNPRFRRILNTIAYSCEHGFKLADAMDRFEDVFDDFEIGIVKSGEATGHLNTMLFQLSSELDKKHDLSLKLWGAAVYPIAVLSVLFLVTIGMLVWVFPTLLNMLTEGGIVAGDLPFATRALLTLQTAVTDYWWAILMVVFALFGMFKMYVATSYGAVKWDYMKLKIPIVGGLLRRLYVLRFVSMIGLLVESGLPVIKSLKITGGALSNRLYRIKTQEVIDVVKDGGKISDSLSDSEYLFPPEVSQMIRVGEKSASLAKISIKISDQYQREIDNSLKKISSVFEPVMILFVGLFVGLLALAVMAPIFNLSTLIQ